MAHAAADSGSGFVTYYWPLPGKTEVAPKLAFVTHYKPWDWIIATGVYIDHTNARLLDRAEGFAVGAPFSLGLELDPDACEFAAFAKSPETRSLMETFPEFKTAINIFQNRIRQDLDGFNSALTLAIDAERALKTTRIAAEEIYSNTTPPALGAVRVLLHQVRDTARQHIKTDSAVLAAAQSVRSRVIGFSAAAVLVGILLTFFIARYISRPLVRSVGFIKNVAQGDLTGRIDIRQSAWAPI